MIVIHMPSGDRCLGSLVDKSTDGTSLTGFPVAKVVIRLDLPVPWSPATTIRIAERAVAMDTASASRNLKFNKKK